MRLSTTPILLALLLLDSRDAIPDEPKQPSTLPIRVLALDGRVLEGLVLEPRGTSLHLVTSEGPRDLDLAEVLEVSTGVPAAGRDPLPAPGTFAVEADLVNGDLLRGVLARGLGEKGFVVRSAALGEVEVAMESLSALRLTANYARTEDPPALPAPDRADRILFVSGDRLEGTIRSAGPDGVRVRTPSGEERTLRLDDLLGFALAPLPRTPAEGLVVRLALAEGTRVSGSAVDGAEGTWILRGAAGGKDRRVPAARVTGIAVGGGRGTPLSDLAPSAVDVKPYWGDDPPVLLLRPVVDRAFTLDRGPAPPLRLGGRTYLRGLSVFSGTTVHYDLEGKGFRSFVAAAGVDDAGPLGAVEFEVLLDGKSAWRSGVVKALPPGGEPAAAPRIDLAGAKRLTLVVHAGPGDDVQDFADWVRAAFLP